jgi:hypothetical protein
MTTCRATPAHCRKLDKPRRRAFMAGRLRQLTMTLALATASASCAGAYTSPPPGSPSGNGSQVASPTASGPTVAPSRTSGPGTFTATGAMAQQRDRPGVVVLADGRVLVVGGYRLQTEALSSAELYDPSVGSWDSAGETRLSGSSLAASLPDGRILVAGGGLADIYDPQSGMFVSAGSTVKWRDKETATPLLDGRVLFAGGYDLSGSPNGNYVYLSSAELYDPATGKWLPTGSMKTARENAQAVRLTDGRVLVAGGDQGDAAQEVQILSSAELYDPATGRFTPIGSMGTARTGFTATLLPDGRVLVAGGFTGEDTLSTAELYDPAAGTFTPTGSMSEGRYEHAAALLRDGRVLVVGGTVDPSAEIYDPSSGEFTSTGSLSRVRGQPLAVRLVDGRVLVFGGTDDNSAELYWP